MCGNNPNVAPQVNNAKCIGGTALGFAIVTIVGFLLDWPGAISAVAGILSVIANSIVCCCGPKAKGEGAGKSCGRRTYARFLAARDGDATLANLREISMLK